MMKRTVLPCLITGLAFLFVGCSTFVSKTNIDYSDKWVLVNSPERWYSKDTVVLYFKPENIVLLGYKSYLVKGIISAGNDSFIQVTFSKDQIHHKTGGYTKKEKRQLDSFDRINEKNGVGREPVLNYLTMGLNGCKYMVKDNNSLIFLSYSGQKRVRYFEFEKLR